MGGLAGVNLKATEALNWIAEAEREQLGLCTDSKAIVTQT